MDHQSQLEIIYFLVSAIIAVPLFRKLGLGAILGYLVAGAVIGPYALKLIPDPKSAMHLAEMGVVMLLFVIGLEINPARLWQARNKVAILGGAQMLVTAAIFTVLLAATFFSLQAAILIALTLALSSTAFAVPLMEEKNYMATPLGRDAFAILLLQDLAVVPLLLLLNAWANTGTAESGVPLWWGLVAIVGVILVGRFLLTPLLNLIARYGSREIMTAMDLLLVLGTAVLMESVGLSMGMGAFIAGLLLTSSSFKHQLAADIEPFKGLLLGLFFIAVGMTLDLQLLLASPFIILGLALVLMLVKALVMACLFRLFRYPFFDAFILGLILSQGGEFAFVIMDKAKLLEFIPDIYANYAVLTVGVSMALTVPLVIIAQRLKRKEQTQTQAYEKPESDSNEVIIIGFGRFGQIIGRILRASEIAFTALEKNADQVTFMKEFGAKSYVGDATRMDLLEAAGIAKAKTLVVAIDSIEDSLTIIREVKKCYPHIQFVVRARNRQHAYQLADLGIHNAIRETFESSLVAAAETLANLGFTDSQVIDKVSTYRQWDEAMLHEAAKIHQDEAALRSHAKKGTEELRQLMNRSDI